MWRSLATLEFVSICCLLNYNGDRVAKWYQLLLNLASVPVLLSLLLALSALYRPLPIPLSLG
jgi:hypothetical protein